MEKTLKIMLKASLLTPKVEASNKVLSAKKVFEGNL